MNRFVLRIIISMLFSVVPMWAAAFLYDVGNLPNPHMLNKADYVCNPDNILSVATCKEINEMAIRLDNMAEVELVVIAISSFDEKRYDAEEYARRVFDYWGIGKRGKNTGVLILLATESRDIRIQTGGGLEGLLPDAMCIQIIEAMQPLLAKEKWDAGIFKGVELIYQELQSPAAQSELLLGWNPRAVEETIATRNMYYWYAILCCIALIFFSLYTYRQFRSYQGLMNNVRYKKLQDKLYLLFLGAVICPLPVVFLLAYYKRQLRCVRTRPIVCHTCGHGMQLLSEAEEDAYLSSSAQAEERVKTIDYDVWLCPNCKETLILPYRLLSVGYKRCSVCGALTETMTGNVIIRQATARHEGIGERRYICKHCGHTRTETYVIPQQSGAVIVPLGGGSGRSGGGFSGGSFGGGISFGGGAGGKF